VCYQSNIDLASACALTKLVFHKKKLGPALTLLGKNGGPRSLPKMIRHRTMCPGTRYFDVRIFSRFFLFGKVQPLSWRFHYKQEFSPEFPLRSLGIILCRRLRVPDVFSARHILYLGEVVLELLPEHAHVLAVEFIDSCQYDLPVPHLGNQGTCIIVLPLFFYCCY
jgi:hypothetical protein